MNNTAMRMSYRVSACRLALRTCSQSLEEEISPRTRKAYICFSSRTCSTLKEGVDKKFNIFVERALNHPGYFKLTKSVLKLTTDQF